MFFIACRARPVLLLAAHTGTRGREIFTVHERKIPLGRDDGVPTRFFFFVPLFIFSLHC